MEDRWFGNEFQILGATDENDLEVAMVVLCGGTHIEKDEVLNLAFTIFTLTLMAIFNKIWFR